jgi:hypothetical protein
MLGSNKSIAEESELKTLFPHGREMETTEFCKAFFHKFESALSTRDYYSRLTKAQWAAVDKITEDAFYHRMKEAAANENRKKQKSK